MMGVYSLYRIIRALSRGFFHTDKVRIFSPRIIIVSNSRLHVPTSRFGRHGVTT